jgi:hypothetical protein
MPVFTSYCFNAASHAYPLRNVSKEALSKNYFLAENNVIGEGNLENFLEFERCVSYITITDLRSLTLIDRCQTKSIFPRTD